MDCYGKSDVLGKKAGKDIENAKCTWFIVQALSLGNEEQRFLLKVIKDILSFDKKNWT